MIIHIIVVILLQPNKTYMKKGKEHFGLYYVFFGIDLPIVNEAYDIASSRMWSYLYIWNIFLNEEEPSEWVYMVSIWCLYEDMHNNNKCIDRASFAVVIDTTALSRTHSHEGESVAAWFIYEQIYEYVLL